MFVYSMFVFKHSILSLSVNENIVVAGCGDGYVRLWNITSG